MPSSLTHGIDLVPDLNLEKAPPQHIPVETQLPNPKQNWAHSTCSMEELSRALLDPLVTAIEADIVMGYEVNNKISATSNSTQPIMAHTPDTESDLSFSSFFRMTTVASTDTNNYHDNNDNDNDASDSEVDETSNNYPGINCESSSQIKKHLKLDFKEIEALKPVLDILGNTISISNNNKSDYENENENDRESCEEEKVKTIYLNADILHGPGSRYGPLSITSDEFMRVCLQFLRKDVKRQRQVC